MSYDVIVCGLQLSNNVISIDVFYSLWVRAANTAEILAQRYVTSCTCVMTILFEDHSARITHRYQLHPRTPSCNGITPLSNTTVSHVFRTPTCEHGSPGRHHAHLPLSSSVCGADSHLPLSSGVCGADSPLLEGPLSPKLSTRENELGTELESGTLKGIVWRDICGIMKGMLRAAWPSRGDDDDDDDSCGISEEMCGRMRASKLSMSAGAIVRATIDLLV